MPEEEPKDLHKPAVNNPYVKGRYKETDRKYTVSDCAALVTHMEKGGSFETFAGEIEVTVDSIKDWVKKYPKFARAYDLAMPKFQLFWEKKLMEANKNTNASVLKMIMQNYFNWHITDARRDDEKEVEFPQIIMERYVAKDS